MAKKINLFYIANSRMPTEKAHGLEIAKLCEALSKYFEVTLILPRRLNMIVGDIWDYYNIKESFTIHKLPVIDFIYYNLFGKIGFWLETVIYSFFLFFYVLFKTGKEDYFFSHENLPLLPVALMRKNVFYDIHDYPDKWRGFYKILFSSCKGAIVTNQWKKERLLKDYNIRAEKIEVLPNGVDLQEFDLPLSQSQARKIHNIPLNKKIIVYTGHLYKWKGVHTLAKASFMLPKDYLIYLVGGTKNDIAQFKKNFRSDNLIMVGMRPHKEMPSWLKAADVLVLPNTAKEAISKYYTSPMKLFEYMVSARPIVASSLPSIRQIVNEDMAYFFQPDEAEDLAKQLVLAAEDENRMDKAKRAYDEVQKYSWDNRAKMIYYAFTK